MYQEHLSWKTSPETKSSSRSLLSRSLSSLAPSSLCCPGEFKRCWLFLYCSSALSTFTLSAMGRSAVTLHYGRLGISGLKSRCLKGFVFTVRERIWEQRCSAAFPVWMWGSAAAVECRVTALNKIVYKRRSPFEPVLLLMRTCHTDELIYRYAKICQGHILQHYL